MDRQRFDDLTRTLARGLSRRALLKTLGGALTGDLLGLAGEEQVGAYVCRAGGVLCLQDSQCCSGSCDQATHQCACADGQILCRDRCIPPCVALDACHVAGVCDPDTGQCTNPPAVGQPCGAGPSCANGVATTQATCDASGTCAAGATVQCAPYVCGATACLTSCSSSAECANGNYCTANGQCVPLLANGAACGSADQCASTFCVDGVCCDAACGGQCEACNLSGSAGTCTAVTGQPVGGRPACASDGSACGGSCDGQTTAACAYPGSGTTCRQASCANGTETLAATCDGAGRCPAAQTQSCGAYVCNAEGTACLTSCTDDNQCVTGAYCDTTSGTCKQDLANGTACARGLQCASGFCVDGVCCDNACTGQCEACNLTDRVGACAAVTGAPVGGRQPCAGATTPCAGTCNGTDTQACSFPGSGTTCGTATCSGDTLTPGGTCDGKGGCTAGTATSCSPYLCNSGGTACSTTCASFTDCASGFQCDEERQCVACAKVGEGCEDRACCSGLTCDVGTLKCACPSGTCGTNCANTVCNGACVDTQTDVHNCGGCGQLCHLNETCVGGVCTCAGSAINPNYTCCAGGGGQCAPPPGGGYALPGYPSGCAGAIGSCPSGTTPCVGPSCQACCPTGSTCDTAHGTCFVA